MAVTGQTIAFAVHGPIQRSDLPGLCDRVCTLFARTAPSVAFCDVSDVPADAVTVDALARLQLGAKRAGCTVRLRNASPQLLGLVAFMGLENVFPDGGGTGRAPGQVTFEAR
jgi:ABC-type transporter Mla MlaB component